MIRNRRSHATSFFVGIALTIALVWTMTSWRADAAPSVGSGETTFTPVAPVRILDTRDGNDVGLAGPFASKVSQVLSVNGVPPGTTGVALNVTVVSPSAAGFISVEPGNATGVPTTSSLNFDAGVVQPNAVTASVPTTGPGSQSIRLTYDAYGVAGPTTDIIVDLLGYYTNRGIQSIITELAAKVNANVVYTRSQIDAALAAKASTSAVYTRAQVDAIAAAKANTSAVYTRAQVDSIAAAKANSSDVYVRFEVNDLLNLKANIADVYHRDDVDLIASAKADLVDVYTRSQADAAFIAQGDIVIYLGSNFSVDANDSSDPNYNLGFSTAGAEVSGSGSALMSLPGTGQFGTTSLGLSSVHYCVQAAVAGGIVVSAIVANGSGTIATDASPPAAGGCGDITIPAPDTTGGQHLLIQVADSDGGAVSTVTLNDVRTTWTEL